MVHNVPFVAAWFDIVAIQRLHQSCFGIVGPNRLIRCKNFSDSIKLKFYHNIAFIHEKFLIL